MGRHIVGFVLLFLLAEIAQLISCGRCIETEQQALLKFKASIHDDRDQLSSWNPKASCCQWNGISCHNVTGHVLKLDLSRYFLNATGVDPSLLELKHLIYLDLSGNNFNYVSIPAFFSSMERLRYLSISNSNFIGKVPANLGGNLTNLQFLDLSRNNLHISDMNWVSRLQSLRYLNLSGVYLGEASNLFQVPHLLPSLLELQLEECSLYNLSTPIRSMNFTNNARVQVLNLAHNEIDGRILHAFQNWTSIEHLDLSYNNISSLPLWFGEFQNMISLDLSDNALCGPIPIALRNLTSLEVLDLSWNDLHISDMNWASKFQSLQYLNLSYVYLGEAHNLFQVLHTLPSLLELQLEECSLYNLSTPIRSMNFTNNARVQVLNLAHNEIDGRILHAFQNWTSIEHLDLSYNNISSLPLWFGEFQNMISLDLSDNALCGPIPIALRNLTSLEVLDLSWNDLHISDMNWASKFQSLQYLNLSYVYLGEAHNLFQVLHTLPSLLELQLEECSLYNLSTPIRSMNFTNNARVQVLNLAYNEIDGRILHAFQNWTSIEHLDLSYNNISSLPLWFGEFQNMISLDLSDNALCGPIPIALRNLTSLEVLHLSLNNFSSIPSWLGELRSLRDLRISGNQIIATVEISVSQILKNMCHLKRLYLDGSNLQGEAFGDSYFSGCIKYDIEELYLRDNKLSGHLPTWVGHLEKLNYLDLSMNNFFRNIPQSFGQLKNLIGLYLSSNFFSGNIPQSLGQLENLTILDLSNNSFSGNIPQSLSQLVSLTILDLSNNSFSGNIPQILKQLANLQSLSLSRNSILTGSIPKFLCHFKDLNNLDLSHNNFSGEIPNCWGDSPPFALTEINFSFNKLSGAFPISIAKLSSLHWLYLNNNSLEGKLPLTLKNLTELRILDLGENKFFGSISSWTSNTFPNLQILRLRNNMFDGNIPSNLCQLPSLQILDLGNNNLTGSIPHCIGNLTGMTKDSADIRKSWRPYMLYREMDWSHMKMKLFLMVMELSRMEMEWSHQDVKQVMKGREFDYTRILQFMVNLDLSNNNLVGSIPFEIFSLTGLIGLNLSHNHLKGEIQEIIGNMKSLESFDISCNQISSIIPRSMSKLTSLSDLNVSYNNLLGPIPTENQFLTLNDPSIYAGNPYLCGIPLQNKCQGDDTHEIPKTKELEDDNDLEKIWFYFVIAIGFVVGFWGAIGTLVLKKSWRYACFRLVEDAVDDIYVFTSIKIAKIKRLLTNHVHGRYF